MPRDISGNYTLPAGNPVVDGTLIEVTWANPTLSDIATQLNNVVTRDGSLGPTAPVLFASGSVGAPSISFTADPTTGFYRVTASTIGFAIAGVLKARLNGTGLGVGASPDVLFHVGGSAPVASFAGTTGSSLVLAGNKDGGGAAGPSILAWANGAHRWGRGTSFTGTGGVFTQYMELNATGLAVGTVDPTVKLDVQGGSDVNIVAIRGTAEAGSALVYTENQNVSAPQWYVGHNGIDVDTGNLRAGSLNLVTSGSTRVKISPLGQVVHGGTLGSYWTQHQFEGATYNGLFINDESVGGTPVMLQITKNSAPLFSVDSAGLCTAVAFSGSISGNAATATLAAAATVLATPRNINGVAFNGSADITVTAAAGTLSGGTLASGVTASSLTSAGATLNLVGGAAGALSIGGAITRFESAEIACPSGTYTDTSTAHGGPRTPDMALVYLRCKTTEAGFAAGDEVIMNNDIGDAVNAAYQNYANATTVGFQMIRSGSTAPAVRHKATGVLTTLTAGNWKLVFRCLWL